ncbi:MAG: hypothetical protein HS111_33110 [Kofleriaceae bacterium]|nr:hypothetical protein [Kofleriaceae bacterium]
MAAATIWLDAAAARERFTGCAGLRISHQLRRCGRRAGATSAAATTSDVERVTAYAGRDGARQVIVLVSKATVPLAAGVRVAAPLRTFVAADALGAGRRRRDDRSDAALAPVATNAFRVPLPRVAGDGARAALTRLHRDAP